MTKRPFILLSILGALAFATALPAKAAPLFPEQSPALRQYVEDDQSPVIGAKIASEGFLVADASSGSADVSPSDRLAADVVKEGKAWSLANSGLLDAKNFTLVAYGTYSLSKTPHRLGGGIWFSYNISDNVSSGIGLDYLGEATMPSGNVTLKVPVKPFSKLGFLEDFLVVPFGIAAIGVPVGGTGDHNGGPCEIVGGGMSVKLVTLNKFDVGLLASATKWINAGAYDGTRLHIGVVGHLSF